MRHFMAFKSAFRTVVAIAAMLLPLSAAHAEWREATTPHFTVVSEGSERELVRMAQRLEALHWLLTQATGASPGEFPPVRVRIYMVGSVSDVHRAMGLAPGTSGATGFYRPGDEGALAVVPRNTGDGLDSQTVLFHEYTHHFMMQYMRSPFPAWFVEGFAEVASTSRFEREGTITWGRVANHRQQELQYVDWVPLSQFMSAGYNIQRGDRSPSYGQYWLLAHYLIFSEERRGELRNYIAARNRGASEEDALASFAGGLVALERGARRYQSNATFAYRRPDLPAAVMATPLIRVMSEGEGAIIADELQSTRNLDEDALTALAQRLAGHAARYPGNIAVALLNTRVLLKAERFAEAEAEAARALTLVRDHPRALAYRAASALRAREASGGAMDEAFVARARSYLVRANRLAPDDPVALIGYYQSFNLAGEAAPDVAVDGLHKAMRLLPQLSWLRLQLAIELINRGQRDMVPPILEPLAYSHHRSGAQEQALELLRWVRSGATGVMPTTFAPIRGSDGDGAGSGEGGGEGGGEGAGEGGDGDGGDAAQAGS